MQLISDEYKELNERLHRENAGYGGGGDRRKKEVLDLINQYQPQEILDYGSGKGALAASLSEYRWHEYDPCIPGKDELPKPADMVVCSDVLEHVESEYLETVFDHLRSLSKRLVFCVIGLRPSNKCLPDGRNAHITLLEEETWVEKFQKHFRIVKHWTKGRGKLFIIGEPWD
jgi:hypothetical protein